MNSIIPDFTPKHARNVTQPEKVILPPVETENTLQPEVYKTLKETVDQKKVTSFSEGKSGAEICLEIDDEPAKTTSGTPAPDSGSSVFPVKKEYRLDAFGSIYQAEGRLDKSKDGSNETKLKAGLGGKGIDTSIESTSKKDGKENKVISGVNVGLNGNVTKSMINQSTVEEQDGDQTKVKTTAIKNHIGFNPLTGEISAGGGMETTEAVKDSDEPAKKKSINGGISILTDRTKGAGVNASAGISQNGKSFALSGGLIYTVLPPVRETVDGKEQWSISWKKDLKGGADFNTSNKLSIGAGVANVNTYSGKRVFESAEEAAKFFSNPDYQSDLPEEPSAMKKGEEFTSLNSWSLAGSMGLKAGYFGLSGKQTEGSGVQLKLTRPDEKSVDLDLKFIDKENTDGSFSASVLQVIKGSEILNEDSARFRIDITTEAGKKIYKQLANPATQMDTFNKLFQNMNAGKKTEGAVFMSAAKALTDTATKGVSIPFMAINKKETVKAEDTITKKENDELSFGKNISGSREVTLINPYGTISDSVNLNVVMEDGNLKKASIALKLNSGLSKSVAHSLANISGLYSYHEGGKAYKSDLGNWSVKYEFTIEQIEKIKNRPELKEYVTHDSVDEGLEKLNSLKNKSNEEFLQGMAEFVAETGDWGLHSLRKAAGLHPFDVNYSLKVGNTEFPVGPEFSNKIDTMLYTFNRELRYSMIGAEQADPAEVKKHVLTTAKFSLNNLITFRNNLKDGKYKDIPKTMAQNMIFDIDKNIKKIETYVMAMK